MNRKKFDANEKRIEIFERDGYTCQKCGYQFQQSDLQLAHRINKGKASKQYIERYLIEHDLIHGKKDVDYIIHHDFNLVTSCADCNDSFNVFFDVMKTNRLIKHIVSEGFPCERN